MKNVIEKCLTSSESEIGSENENESEIEIDVIIKTQFDDSLDSGVSPVKLKSVPQHQPSSAAKRKYQKVVFNIANDMSKVYNVEAMSLIEDSKPISSNSDIQNLDRLTNAMKDKLKLATAYSSKIQILTVTPESWSRKKAAQYFEVSEYQVREARRLKNENGILSKPSKKQGKTLSVNTVQKRIL